MIIFKIYKKYKKYKIYKKYKKYKIYKKYKKYKICKKYKSYIGMLYTRKNYKKNFCICCSILVWFLNKREHNNNGPSIIVWKQNDNLNEVHYYKRGKLHHYNKPAFKEYVKNKTSKIGLYYLYNNQYRVNGPETRNWDYIISI